MESTKALVPVHMSRTDMSIEDMGKFAQWAHKSGEFKSLKSPAHAMLLMQYGRELGFGPATSLQLVYSVSGTPSLKANTIASLLKQVKWEGTQKARYDYRVMEKTDERSVIDFYERNDEGRLELRGRQEYSMEDAKRAGLTKNQTYQKYARSMLFARCITEGARTFAPDCLGGIVPYCPEELGYREPESTPQSVPQTIGYVQEADFEERNPHEGGPFDPLVDRITEEEFKSIQGLVTEKGKNLSNLLAQIGADPNDPRGMTVSQKRSIESLLNNL